MPKEAESDLYRRITDARGTSDLPLHDKNSGQYKLAYVLLQVALAFAYINCFAALGFTLIGTFFGAVSGSIVSTSITYADRLGFPALKLIIPIAAIFLHIGVPLLISGFGVYFLTRYFFNRNLLGPAIFVGAARPALFLLGLTLHLFTGHGLSSITGTDNFGAVVMMLVL